jgi:hypothetical protein
MTREAVVQEVMRRLLQSKNLMVQAPVKAALQRNSRYIAATHLLQGDVSMREAAKATSRLLERRDLVFANRWPTTLQAQHHPPTVYRTRPLFFPYSTPCSQAVCACVFVSFLAMCHDLADAGHVAPPIAQLVKYQRKFAAVVRSVREQQGVWFSQ